MCNHSETFEDGTTRFCSYCGESVAYFAADSDTWVEGAVHSDLKWTEDGYVPRSSDPS